MFSLTLGSLRAGFLHRWFCVFSSIQWTKTIRLPTIFKISLCSQNKDSYRGLQQPEGEQIWQNYYIIFLTGPADWSSYCSWFQVLQSCGDLWPKHSFPKRPNTLKMSSTKQPQYQKWKNNLADNAVIQSPKNPNQHPKSVNRLHTH